MADESTIWIIRILKILIVIMGIYISKASYDAYRRQRNKAMVFLSAGFALITVGSLLEGILFEIVSFSLLAAMAVSSVLIALGLLTIIYSVHVVG